MRYRFCVVMTGLMWLLTVPANSQVSDQITTPTMSEEVPNTAPTQIPAQVMDAEVPESSPVEVAPAASVNEEGSASNLPPVSPDTSSVPLAPPAHSTDAVQPVPVAAGSAATVDSAPIGSAPTTPLPDVRTNSQSEMPSAATPVSSENTPTQVVPSPEAPVSYENSQATGDSSDSSTLTPARPDLPNLTPPNFTPLSEGVSSSDVPYSSPEDRDVSSSNWPSMLAGSGGALQTSSPLSNQAEPSDFSAYSMFMQADWVVKSVMIVLAAASIVTWIIWLVKSVEIMMAKKRAIRASKVIIAARSLAEAIESMKGRKGVSVRLVATASEEMRVSLGAVDGAGSDGLKERIASHLYRTEVRAGRVMSRSTGILATIGAVAPFVGLFGTVWGIMNSFIGISQAQTTNLAVVAPGIAEALLATAIGLVAAIPAVVIFNMFARSITVYRQMLADVSAAIERLVSRDLDFRLAHKRAGQPVLSAAAAE